LNRSVRFWARITSFLQARMLPLPGIKLFVGRRARPGDQTKDRVKRRHRIKTAIKTKDIFVEVGLQVLGADGSVVGAEYPGFEV